MALMLHGHFRSFELRLQLLQLKVRCSWTFRFSTSLALLLSRTDELHAINQHLVSSVQME